LDPEELLKKDKSLEIKLKKQNNYCEEKDET
jgi:hypothetical protein